MSTLRPHDPSQSTLLGPIKQVLHCGLRTELVEQIDTRSQLNGDGHELSLLRNIHTKLDKTTDRETADMIHQAIVTLSTVLLAYELDRYSLDIGKTRVLLDASPSFELSYSIEYFWEDEIAINGTILPEEYPSKYGLWTNNDHK